MENLINWYVCRILSIPNYFDGINQLQNLYLEQRRGTYKTSNLPILNFTEFSASSFAQLKAESFYSNFKVF